MKPHYRAGRVYSDEVHRARKLREDSSTTEKLVWELLRKKRFHGLKFRRQHQIGDFIVDFYCDQLKLVVELDGPVHNNDVSRERDELKDRSLNRMGFNVVRVGNKLPVKDQGGFMALLERKMAEIGGIE